MTNEPSERSSMRFTSLVDTWNNLAVHSTVLSNNLKYFTPRGTTWQYTWLCYQIVSPNTSLNSRPLDWDTPAPPRATKTLRSSAPFPAWLGKFESAVGETCISRDDGVELRVLPLKLSIRYCFDVWGDPGGVLNWAHVMPRVWKLSDSCTPDVGSVSSLASWSHAPKNPQRWTGKPCSCPRDWRLSGRRGGPIQGLIAPLGPSQHYRIEGLKEAS